MTALRFLVTGGAGFIGSAVVRHLIDNTRHEVVVLDKLTYAGNVDSLKALSSDPRFRFVRGDVADQKLVGSLINDQSPDIVLHLAAESHVDRSIDEPGAFITTNLVGTFSMLEASLVHWQQLSSERKGRFRFHHISTDEVFGSLGPTGHFTESSPYAPNSPYSASKAGSDHLVRAWHHTYGLPTLLTNCSNNYGPFQFPEKLIPLTIINALQGKPLPVYGNGENVRDWLHVDDHVAALLLVAREGNVGHTYNIGGGNEWSNIKVVKEICQLVDELAPQSGISKRENLITFVKDRPGHDARYAVDFQKIRRQHGWQPKYDFKKGLRETVRWYLDNPEWWERIRSGDYQREALPAFSKSQ